MAQQPIIPNSQGAILTVGMIVNGERLSIVEPYGLDQSSPDRAQLCSDLCNAWAAAAMNTLLTCMSVDAAIVFLAAEGMQDGVIPFRVDYDLVTNVGTIASPALPTSVAGLIAYYEDPADVTPPDRIRVGKTFVPGLPESKVLGQTVDASLVAIYSGYGTTGFNGFASLLYATKNWYRMLSVPKPRSTVANIKRVLVVNPRGYVATQKRRLVPR